MKNKTIVFIVVMFLIMMFLTITIWAYVAHSNSIFRVGIIETAKMALTWTTVFAGLISFITLIILSIVLAFRKGKENKRLKWWLTFSAIILFFSFLIIFLNFSLQSCENALCNVSNKF